jgi:Protein of unknown function (DUF2851)
MNRAALAPAPFYRPKLPPSSCLREPPPEPLTEADLSLIWAGQRFPAEALRAVDGRRLRVLNPGRRGGAAGPDFLDAVLLLDGEERRGDVELHVRASSFRTHGHQADPAYANLALHVVYRADAGEATPLHGGASAPVAAFSQWLEGRSAEIAAWLAAPPLWREPCTDAVARLGPERVRAALQEAGLRRFQARVEATRAAVDQHGEAEALWRSLLDVLGQGGDRDGFRRLARNLTWRHAAATGEALEAELLWVAGLGPPPACNHPALQEPHAGPEAVQHVVPLRPRLAITGRPANHPARRLRGLAALVGRARGDLVAYARRNVATAARPKTLVDAWQAGCPPGPALIGPARAREVVLNAVLPFTAVSPSLENASLALLARLPPAPAYRKTRFLESNLNGGDGRRLVKSALQQQGLLSFLQEWCSRGGCGRCPLSPSP